MLDRAPVLLGPGGDFLDPGNQPVKVTAENTVHFFDPVQILEALTVDDDIVTAPDSGNVIYPETN